MNDRALPIVIIGAGIGGLTAAIALRRAGFPVVVYERAAQLTTVGAGLTIQPNALIALRALGLDEHVLNAGAKLSTFGLLRMDGRALSQLPPAEGKALLAQAGAPLVGIHRATLHQLLIEALGKDVVHLDRACVGYEQQADSVRVRFADGTQIESSLLIGADGLRSVVRQQLIGDGEPLYAGYTSWRGVTSDRCGFAADFGGELLGRGQRFGGCAIDGGRFYWFAVANAPAGEREPSTQTGKAQLIARYAGWDPRVSALIQSTPEHAILRTDIADRQPLQRWGEARVTLLGDAAHPMTPNLGQGACQAIEDAVVLAAQLQSAQSPQAGLRAYEAARRGRANGAVIAARRLGAVVQWQHPLACAFRDWLFANAPRALMKRQMLEGWTFRAEPIAPSSR